MKLSAIIPIYNEIDTILERVQKLRAAGLKKVILFVDDDSTDGTFSDSLLGR